MGASICGLVKLCATGALRGHRQQIGKIVSSVLFGLYHFTHSPPWNNWAQATLLFVVWLFVSLAYVLTRDAWVAAIIDTSFATIGFIRNSVTTLDDVPIMRAVALDALSIGVVAAIL